MRIEWKSPLSLLILIILYVLLGNARSLEMNPFIPGATIAVNMIIPVVGGILFGPWIGFLTGLLGSMVNTLSPAGSLFEMLAILPHALMGMAAGMLKSRYPSPIAAGSLLIGHILNILAFTIFGMITFNVLKSFDFWLGIAYETFIGIIAIIIITTIYRFALRGEA